MIKQNTACGFRIYGNGSTISAMLQSKGIPVSSNETDFHFTVIVLDQDNLHTFNTEGLNTEFVCLINVDAEQADALLDCFQGQLFNFMDIESCSDFLTGYYLANWGRRHLALDIWDVTYALGYQAGSPRKIKSLILTDIDLLADTHGLLYFWFANETIQAAAAYFQEIIARYRIKTAVIAGEPTVGREYKRFLVLQNN
jgi:hypothetical protein